MRYFISILLNTIVASLFAQKNDLFVAAKNGLSLRVSPSLSSKIVKKINYGSKVKVIEYIPTDSFSQIEGFHYEWIKVLSEKDSGYIVDAFLFNVAPPTKKHLDLDAYLSSYNKKVVDSMLIGKKDPNLEENIDYSYKTLFRSGAEITHRQLYESTISTYYLPDFNVQKSFQLLRLLKTDSVLVDIENWFPSKSKTYKRKKSKTEIEIQIFNAEKETWYSEPNHIILKCEDDYYHKIELIKLEFGTLIILSFGV